MPFNQLEIELVIIAVLILLLTLLTYLVIIAVNYFKNKRQVKRLDQQVTTLQKGLNNERFQK